jgi:uncharacterized membrane protein
MPSFFSWFATFLSGACIVWITQVIIARREHRKKIAETNLALFMSWIPCIAGWYVEAISPTKASDEQSFLKKKYEILAILQIMGPIPAIVAFEAFSSMAELAFKKDPHFDKKQFFELFTAFNHSLCCEIHSEGPSDTDFARALTKLWKQEKAK